MDIYKCQTMKWFVFVYKLEKKHTYLPTLSG